MTKNNFYESLLACQVEREVEQLYNEELKKYFPYEIKHPYACDGYLNEGPLNMIIEYKLDKKLKSKLDRAKVLVQVIFYLKRFDDNGNKLPTVALVGDMNEVFVIHTNALLKYLDTEGVDWSVSPSNAHNLTDFVLVISNDDELNNSIFVYDINAEFSFQSVIDKIGELSLNVHRQIRITEKNFVGVFNWFCDNVLRDRNKISPNDLVALFIGVILNKNDYYQHPNKKNELVTPSGKVDIVGAQYAAFISHFETVFSQKEKSRLISICDRLIEDDNRRRKGEFYTPAPFVNRAHQKISELLGENWRDEYVVWDNCWGCGALTKDYKFRELYASTLEQAELDIAKDCNPEAIKFKFDFLNDDLNTLPQGLLDAFKQNKKICILINPPYGTACDYGASSKAKISDTFVRQVMHKERLGSGAENLYGQFLYRIMRLKQHFNLTNLSVNFFTPSLFLTGPKWKKFREVFLKEFKFVRADLFQSSWFANCSAGWGVSFSQWISGETEDKNNFPYHLIDWDIDIQEKGIKILYNTDNLMSASDWSRSTSKVDSVTVPNLSSGLVLKNTDIKWYKDSLAYNLNHSNCIQLNFQAVGIFTSAYGGPGGYSIVQDNFLKCTSLFTARKTIESNWMNQKDEYLAPNESDPMYPYYEADSVIYSLFNSASNQTSLRQVEYKGKNWDIKNEFFWTSKEFVMDLADKCHYDFTYNDAKNSEQRYVATLLTSDFLSKLSPEALDVLNRATDLLVKTFPYRLDFDQTYPNHQIMNWDCGYYQLKTLWKEYYPDDFKLFRDAYKKLSDKLRGQVYSLGFLK